VGDRCAPAFRFTEAELVPSALLSTVTSAPGYAPEQFENLCVLARTLEVFGFARCYVFDPHRIMRER
jgi:hypothetical protein